MGAGHRPATTPPVLCGPIPPVSSATPSTILLAEAIRSPDRARSATWSAPLIAPRLNRAANPSRPNPHSARGTGVPQDSRVPSLQAFRRRPRCHPRRCDGPASETLHMTPRRGPDRNASASPRERTTPAPEAGLDAAQRPQMIQQCGFSLSAGFHLRSAAPVRQHR